jgi:hypothetical protein
MSLIPGATDLAGEPQSEPVAVACLLKAALSVVHRPQFVVDLRLGTLVAEFAEDSLRFPENLGCSG